ADGVPAPGADSSANSKVTRIARSEPCSLSAPAHHASGFLAHCDARGDARRAFATFATPQYYVLDQAGRIVFARAQLADVSLQAAALLPDAPSATPARFPARRAPTRASRAT